MRTKGNYKIIRSFEKHRMTSRKYRLALVFVITLIFAFTSLNALENVKKDEKFYRDQGITKFKSGKYSDAITDFTKAIKLNSKYSVAYLERGLAYHMSDKNDLALNDISKAIKLDGKNSLAYYNRALV